MTETSLLSEATKQVPALAVLCYVVYLFLGKLTLFIDAIKDMQREHIGAYERAQKEHLAERALSREAVKDNTEAMRQNTGAMTHLLERLDGGGGGGDGSER